MKPRTIVSVLDSLSSAKNGALTRALSLAHWYESALHVVHVAPSSRIEEIDRDAMRDELAGRVARVAEQSGIDHVDGVAAVLSGNPVGAVANYTDRVSADLVVVPADARRRRGYWSEEPFAAAVGKAVKAPTIAIPDDHSASTESGALFRRILVPIDFSEVSLRALSEALVLAQQSGGHLRLLHVLQGFPYEAVYSGSRAFRLIHDFRARVARVNRELRSLIPQDALNWSEIDVATESGLAHDTIVAAAAEWGADLVVLGLPRRSRMAELMAGSTVRRVLRRATLPVLLVPGSPTAKVARPVEDAGAQFSLDHGAFVLPAGAEIGSATRRSTVWQ